ncbi:MAG: 4-amino-4-deoxy-L-arabinose transferase-like glycosyltransferase [Myxococcota bacterium]|jgi:4-amino-4-deoxy-L-arabinose transferase-like glycosyltransferase
MARVDALIERWGILAVTLVGAVVLFVSLGSTGLWDPWEMDRAALSQRIVAPPQALVALTADTEREFGTALNDASDRTGLALFRGDVALKPPSLKAPGPHPAVNALLARLRQDVAAAVVLDNALLFPGTDPDADETRAGKPLLDAIENVPNGRVILIERRADASEDYTRSRVTTALRLAREAEITRATERAANDREAGRTPKAIPTFADLPPPLVLLRPSEAALVDALDDARSTHSSVVRFKRDGETRTAPPLVAWLRTASYKVLGRTEFSTRLPGVLLALLTLWILVVTCRTVWGTRVAVLAGIVLVTTPLFFGQARNAAGDPGLMLALALAGCALLLRHAHPRSRVVWAYLIAAMVIGLLASGLTALLLIAVMAVAIPVVTGEKSPRGWALAAVAVAALGALSLWVLNEPATGFAGQFRFTHPLFSSGPSADHRTFEMIYRQVGFGLFPWSPLVVVALGGVLFQAVRKRSESSLVVVVWLALPLVLSMFLLKDFNQFIWPIAPAAAVAVGLLLDLMWRRHVMLPFVALAVLIMGFILAREVGKDAAPLVGFLTVDPPFADKGGIPFPEALKFSGSLKALVYLAAFMVAVYAGTLVTVLKKALNYFRGELPLRITIAVLMVVPPIYWLISAGQAHKSAVRAVTELGGGQRAFSKWFMSLAEPGFLLLLLTSAALAAAAILVYAIPPLRASARRLLDRLSAGGFMTRWLIFAGAGVWLVTVVTMAVQITYPGDFFGETLFSMPSLVAYAVVGILVWLASKLLADSPSRTRELVALAVGLLALCLIVRLVRDAHWRTWPILLGVAGGWALVTIRLLPRLLASPTRFATGAGILIAIVFMVMVVPLLDRYTLIEQVREPQNAGYLTIRLILGSRLAWACYAGIGMLLINRRFPDLTSTVADKLTVLQRGPTVVAFVIVVALAVTAGTTFGVHKTLALDVSQKHILDTWREAEPDASAPERLFKYGNFAAEGSSRHNFYTAELDGITDRQTALKTLLGAEDQVVDVVSTGGNGTRILAGWNPSNDTNSDARRDAAAIRGFATAVTGSTLVDASQTWTPGALVGRRLVDNTGNGYAITANTATSVTVQGAARLPFTMGSPRRAYYVVDAPNMADSRATAAMRERRGMLIPARSLAEIDVAFRKISGGRHLSVLDGRSTRVLLAVGWLKPGEVQQNKIDKAVFTRSEFDLAARRDPTIKRVSGTFDKLIRVVGYSLDTDTIDRGSPIALTVYYEALKAIPRSYKIFIHNDLIGDGGERIAGDHWPLNPTKHSDDNKNCGGCLRTDLWMAGDIVADRYEMETSEKKRGEYRIFLGWFDPGGDKRLKVGDYDKKAGVTEQGNRLGIGTFRIR